jgi:hypothetical protein
MVGQELHGNSWMHKKGGIMDITKFGITELKAMAYDEQVKVEVARNNLLVLAQEIQKRMTPPVGTPPVMKEVKKDKKDESKTV